MKDIYLRAYRRPKTLRPATEEKNCSNCVHFSSVAAALPGGWCENYPCKKVNCGVQDVCDEWDRPIEQGESLDKYTFAEVKEMARLRRLKKGMTKTVTLEDGTTAVAIIVATKGAFVCGTYAKDTIFAMRTPAKKEEPKEDTKPTLEIVSDNTKKEGGDNE